MVDAPGESELARAIDGDEAAFSTLYREIQPKLRRYAWTLVGQDADDVTAEAWLQIAGSIRGFTGDLDGFRGWTARIVRNRAIDHLRASQRRPLQLTDIEALLDTPGVSADKIALEAISTDVALALIASLPREQAEAVLLRAVVGLDAKTAGAVLGKSGVAVRVAAHRGLKALALRVSADGTVKELRDPAKTNRREAGRTR